MLREPGAGGRFGQVPASPWTTDVGAGVGVVHTGVMDQTITATVDADIAAVRAVLRDLTTYQHWLDLVDEVDSAESHPDDRGPAYLVTLVARVGPLARRKRLRMVRTHDHEAGAVFERVERDGRDHSAWRLGAAAHPGESTVVEMRLAYGGTLWSDALGRVLAAQINDAAAGLAEFARNGRLPR